MASTKGNSVAYTRLLSCEEEKVITHVVQVDIPAIIPIDRYSCYNHLIHVTGWIFRFIRNFQLKGQKPAIKAANLTIEELGKAENYWVSLSQGEHFASEIQSLRAKLELPNSSSLLPLRPFLDNTNVLRVGGRISNAELSLSQCHPMIIHGKHPLARLLIHSEHKQLLHAGPTLLMSSINRRFHVIGLRQAVHSITRQCDICRRRAARTGYQLMGQVPKERLAPGSVFDQVGVDYAGPVLIKY